MKKLIPLLVVIPTLLFGQEKRFEFGVMIGNNGQLDKTLNDFYFWGHESAYLDDSRDAKTTNLKFGASARFFISEMISVRLKFGTAIRKDFYTKNSPTTYLDYDIKQNIFNINPSICFSKPIGKFEIATGIEIPLIIVDDFNFKSDYKQIPDSVNVTEEINSTVKMTGGFIWGINNFISVKYFFSKQFGIGAEINYGMLFADIGEKVEQIAEYVLPTQPTNVSEWEKQYKKTFFSTPEVSVGLFLRLWNKKQLPTQVK